MSQAATGSEAADSSGDDNPAPRAPAVVSTLDLKFSSVIVTNADIELTPELHSRASATVTPDAGPNLIGQNQGSLVPVESRLRATSMPALRDYATEQFNQDGDVYHSRDEYLSPTEYYHRAEYLPLTEHLPRAERPSSTEYLRLTGNFSPTEYLPRESDEVGEREVDANGQLLGGREYKCRTFFLPDRGDKLFILASECAMVLGYLNSHSLFNENKPLYKIIASEYEKEYLIHRNILTFSDRFEEVTIVTAKSIFQQFGSRIAVDGTLAHDDYWEDTNNGELTEEDIPGGKRPGAVNVKRAAATARTTASGSAQGGKMPSYEMLDIPRLSYMELSPSPRQSPEYSPSHFRPLSSGMKRMAQGYPKQGTDPYQPDLNSENFLEIIKQQILYSLRETVPEDGKRKKHRVANTSATTPKDFDHLPTRQGFTVRFVLNWNPAKFMKEQFPEYRQKLIGSVIVLTGSAICAQATTVRDYLKRHWPDTGLQVLEILQKGLDVGASANGKLTIGREALPQPLVEWTCIDASAAEVVEVCQQLAWLGSAIQTSPSGRVGRSHFRMVQQDDFGTSPRFLMEFSVTSLGDEENSCWHDLFFNPVIAYNFPIEERHFGNGLEIPIHMMAALGGASQAVEFDGGIVIKGFSSMFVPLKRVGDSIQWHYIKKEDDTRFPYSEVNHHCPGRALLENVDFKSLTTTRAFLGWWGNITSHLGTADANYHNIDWSDTKEPGRPVVLRSANLGLTYFGSGQLVFSAGLKDGKLHISRTGPYQRIVKHASRTPVILYDTSEKRGWLVPSSAVIAHVAQTRHFHEGFSIDGKPVKFTATDSSLDIYEGAEKMLLSNSEVKIGQDEFGMGEFLFKDLVHNIWGLIESLIDKDIKMDLTNDIPLNGILRPNLRGWEFMDVVTERSPIRLKEARIQKSHGGWIDLAQDLNAVVFFASGFEDLIKPAKESGLCHVWRRVPKDKDYLTASVSMLNTLYEEAGSRLSQKHLTSTHLQWHRGAALFEACPNSKNYQCTCDRLQQILQGSWSVVHQFTPPGPLEERGAVIFGTSRVLSRFGIPSWEKRLSRETSPSQQTKTNLIYSQENIPFLNDAASTGPPISGQDSSGSITTYPSLARVATSLPEQERVLSNSYSINHPRRPLNDGEAHYSASKRVSLQRPPEGSYPSQRRSIP
ncbi:pfs domain protein [Rutstroemia sp. NJR-2017a WRK4]|nr:pfs domain protein [Rutstroemia sp. NJR-2017a WRK4]